MFDLSNVHLHSYKHNEARRKIIVKGYHMSSMIYFMFNNHHNVILSYLIQLIVNMFKTVELKHDIETHGLLVSNAQ